MKVFLEVAHEQKVADYRFEEVTASLAELLRRQIDQLSARNAALIGSGLLNYLSSSNVEHERIYRQASGIKSFVIQCSPALR